MKQTVIIFAALVLFLSSCKKEDDPTPSLETAKITNFHAPADVRDQQTGEIIQASPYVYFNFETGKAVDSLGNWDIAFKGTTIITNSGVSGTGNAKATVVSATFADVTEAPADSELKVDTDVQKAISKEACWSYNPATHLLSPVAGRVIVVKTNDGKYAKVELISYYKDAPTVPNPLEDESGYLTFNYIYQGDGTSQF